MEKFNFLVSTKNLFTCKYLQKNMKQKKKKRHAPKSMSTLNPPNNRTRQAEGLLSWYAMS